MSSLSGRKFDHWYTRLEVKDHEQDIQETTDEITMGQNADIKNDAQQDLPMLRTHLRLSQTAERKAG